MKRYNAVCPLCGAENKNLYLELTDGWMRCRICRKEAQAQIYEVAGSHRSNVSLKKIKGFTTRKYLVEAIG